MNNKVTIRDVARLAGVSEPVVSTVLNKVEDSTVRVSPQTRERVEKVARELNYTPNIIGRSLRQQKTYVIGLLLGEINANLTADVIRGVQDIASPRQYSPMVLIHGTATQETEHLELCLERRVDALIVDTFDSPPSNKNAERYRGLAADGFPVVELFGTSILGVPRVNIDFRADGRQAAQHLIDLGHRRISLVIADRFRQRKQYWSAWEFWQGYRDAMEEAELEQVVVPARSVASANDTWAFGNSGREAAAEILDDPGGVTGVVCFDERRAFGLMQEFQHAHVEVPTEVSVVGYCGGDVSALTTPALTAFDISARRAAQVATQTVFDLMDGQPVADGKVASHLVWRQTTRSPAGALRPRDIWSVEIESTTPR